MSDPTWAQCEPTEQEAPKHRHECMTANAEYAEAWFDANPPTTGTRAHLAQTNYGCACCEATISVLSDYGFFDFAECESPQDEPEYVPLCWQCIRDEYRP